MIAPYRQQIEEQLGEVLGHAAGEFVKTIPRARSTIWWPTRCSTAPAGLPPTLCTPRCSTRGGIRVPVAQGPILMRHAYELLPFENFVTVLSLSGKELERLADEVAPHAWRAHRRLDDGAGRRRRVNVRVGGAPVDPAAVYRLATVDYLVNGGGSWTVLWEPRAAPREDLTVLIRDVFVDYVRERGTVAPTLDGRIRPAAGPGARQ